MFFNIRCVNFLFASSSSISFTKLIESHCKQINFPLNTHGKFQFKERKERKNKEKCFSAWQSHNNNKKNI